jgi:ComF family protein
VRALVWELKYYKQSRAAALAGEYLADILLAEAEDSIGRPLLIPVPMHAERRKQRGHNQTEVLCESVLKNLGNIFEYAPDILERVRNTVPQQGLMKHKRLRNVKNSMQIKDPARVRGRVCIVVDDVSTTGATLHEAARALRDAGASSVVGVALAHS